MTKGATVHDAGAGYDLTTRQGLLDTARRTRAAVEQAIADARPDAWDERADGGWNLKDLLVHLTGWRWYSVARLEAGVAGSEPVKPYPDSLPDEEDGPVDEVNAWFQTQGRGMSREEAIADSTASFDRLEAALAALDDDRLFTVDRYPWLRGYALGPGVIEGTFEHHMVDHLADLHRWR